MKKKEIYSNLDLVRIREEERKKEIDRLVFLTVLFIFVCIAVYKLAQAVYLKIPEIKVWYAKLSDYDKGYWNGFFMFPIIYFTIWVLHKVWTNMFW